MKIKLYALLTASLLVGYATAQDIHFSQFYASPLTLNPALTGNFNGFYRITGIYRNQYPGLTQGRPAFSTPSVGVDFSLLREKIKKGALGVGLVFFNDQQNGKTFNNNQILASLAYNMGFGSRNQFQLGVGLQGGVAMTKMDFSNFQFADGFKPDLTYDPNYNGETFNSGNRIKGAVNAGIFTKFEFIRGMRYYMGYSFNNATNYKQDFLKNAPVYRLPFRHTGHGGFEFDLKDKAVLIPGFLFQQQAKANETNFGLTAGIHVIRDPAKRATLYLGYWNRVNTGNYTAIPKVGFEWKGFRAGFAYDAHLGRQFKDHKNIGGAMPQGFEVSLGYIGNLFVPKEDNYLFNPIY
ncbi:MAG: PorP/SprF family type IX secretion system membrane protein [Chitinophagales bacterium]|nr:PorP/SprF family type IX secretion system membrane protein [Chitinophagales bacterium]MDW8417848.1 PorP/SprF family type IX secretion system membrane protein [Chitinophagales bacterium]